MIKYEKKRLELIVSKSETYRQVLLAFERNTSSASYKILKRKLKEWNISIDHFLSSKDVVHKLQKEGKLIKYSDDDIFKKSNIGRGTVKKRFLTKVEKKCVLCGQDENWNGMKISLIMDHKNGINIDHRFENLRLLCPNCNAGIPTHCKGNIGILNNINKQIKLNNKIDKRTLYNGVGKPKQRKVERPSYNELIKDINNLGYLGTGRKYGVSDNSIRKWKNFYEKQASMV